MLKALDISRSTKFIKKLNSYYKVSNYNPSSYHLKESFDFINYSPFYYRQLSKAPAIKKESSFQFKVIEDGLMNRIQNYKNKSSKTLLDKEFIYIFMKLYIHTKGRDQNNSIQVKEKDNLTLSQFINTQQKEKIVEKQKYKYTIREKIPKHSFINRSRKTNKVLIK